MSHFPGKVAVVTGGTRGIGLAIAAWMIQHGASVVISGRDADRLNVAVKELARDGGPVAGLVADAARREDADRLVETARERFGHLDVLVNNAGITRDGLVIRMKDEDWDRVLETNLKGAFLMTRAASKAMVRSKTGGRIINIASTAGAMGNAGQANYSAAKAGLIGLTKATARGGRKSVLLPVSAPFHCALMAPAAERLAGELAGIAVSDPTIPVVRNVDAGVTHAAKDVLPFLLRQVASPVRWTACVQRLAAEGATAFVEVGPGRVLTALTKRIVEEARAFAVEDPGALEKAAAAVA